MSTTTDNRQPAARSALGRLVVRHPVAAFLIMIYAVTWVVFLPVVLQGRGLLALPIELSQGLAFNAVVAIASIVGVALPAYLVTAATDGKEGVRDLLRRSSKWRVGAQWYLMALFGLLVAMLVGASVFLGMAPLEALLGKWPLLFTMFLPEVLLPFLFIQIFEEAGWTGFMQHTLQERRGPIVASVLVAPAFILMHLPPLLIDSELGLSLLIGHMATIRKNTATTTKAPVIYNGSGRSVLIVALFHSAFNSATSLGEQEFTGELISGPTLPYAVGALVVVAAVITAFTKERLGYEPERPTPPTKEVKAAAQPTVQ